MNFVRPAVVFCVAAFLAGGPRVSADLLLRYSFDEASSGTTPALDSGAAPAANGVFTNSATRTANTPGSFSVGALNLTGGGAVNNWVAATDPDKLDGLSVMTITAWVNFQAAPVTSDRLVSKLLSSGGNFTGFDWRFSNTGALAFSEVNDAASLVTASSTVAISTNAG
jgi:hypothetical protein